jgi:hypothetical protein
LELLLENQQAKIDDKGLNLYEDGCLEEESPNNSTI